MQKLLCQVMSRDRSDCELKAHIGKKGDIAKSFQYFKLIELTSLSLAVNLSPVTDIKLINEH